MAVSVSVRTRVPQVTAELHRRAAMIVEKTARDIEADAKHAAPVDTGLLRNSIHAQPVTPLRWLVISPVNYSTIVEYGSAPHIIRARQARALFWPGAAHPVREVHHPGTRPQPFMTPAAELNRARFEQAMRGLVT